MALRVRNGAKVNLTSNKALYALAALSALCVLGCIAQVLLEIGYGKTADVNPVLGGLAESSIFALFGQGFFSQHAQTTGDMRSAFGSALQTVATATAQAANGGTAGPTTLSVPVGSTTTGFSPKPPESSAPAVPTTGTS